MSALEVLYLEKEKVDGPDALLKAIFSSEVDFLSFTLGFRSTRAVELEVVVQR